MKQVICDKAECDNIHERTLLEQQSEIKTINWQSEERKREKAFRETNQRLFKKLQIG